MCQNCSGAKVNTDTFRAGGGSNGDFERYDLNQDGLLDMSELEARAINGSDLLSLDRWYW